MVEGQMEQCGHLPSVPTLVRVYIWLAFLHMSESHLSPGSQGWCPPFLLTHYSTGHPAGFSHSLGASCVRQLPVKSA